MRTPPHSKAGDAANTPNRKAENTQQPTRAASNGTKPVNPSANTKAAPDGKAA